LASVVPAPPVALAPATAKMMFAPGTVVPPLLVSVAVSACEPPAVLDPESGVNDSVGGITALPPTPRKPAMKVVGLPCSGPSASVSSSSPSGTFGCP
jgi:hypothetical protein